MSELNLRKLRASRSSLRAGDIFAMQLSSARYLFGRVIEADIPRGATRLKPGFEIGS
jgi:hypothetical protein